MNRMVSIHPSVTDARNVRNRLLWEHRYLIATGRPPSRLPGLSLDHLRALSGYYQRRRGEAESSPSATPWGVGSEHRPTPIHSKPYRFRLRRLWRALDRDQRRERTH